MKKLQCAMFSLMSLCLVLVGTFGGMTTNCFSFYYQPEKPAALK